MSFKKVNWSSYKRRAKSIELNIKDYYEQTIDFFKIEKGDKNNKRILKKIKDEYGFDINEEDNSWLKKDNTW
jgi:hypothetical protein